MAETRPNPTGEGPTRDAVRDRLDDVRDPELDRSIVELDYVDEIEIEGTHVRVVFTLPTAWCSPAFAWMMASDARDEVRDLPGVIEAEIVLRDHMHDEEITRGVNGDEAFGDVFPDADGGVRDVRATLDDKARLARQLDAVDGLLEAGLDPEQIVDLRRDDVEITDGHAVVSVRGIGVTVPVEPIAAYLRTAGETGHVTVPTDRLFRTQAGDPIPPDRFDAVRKRSRLASVNMGGQGAVCDALNDARREKLDRE